MLCVPGSKIDPARHEAEQVGSRSDKNSLVPLTHRTSFEVQVHCRLNSDSV